MDRKELGQTGTRLPEVGLGTSQYSGGTSPLRQAIELGAFFIDTAESYGTEEMVGEAVKGIRQRVFLSTKVAWANLGRGERMKAAEGSLVRLRTDHIDLYQIHSPNSAIPIRETMTAMEDLVDAGKVRFIGVSNFTLGTEKSPSGDAQISYRLESGSLQPGGRTIETERLAYCQQHRITILAYSPLAGGLQNLQAIDKHGVLGGWRWRRAKPSPRSH